MAFPLGNFKDITAHRVSLIQGNAVVDIVDLINGGGGGDVSGDIAALQANDIVHDAEISQLGTDVAAVDQRVDGAVATNTTQGVAIAGKQDQLSAPAGAGQVSLLNGASSLKALQAGTGVSLTNAGGHVVVEAAGSSLTAAAPITITNGAIGIDMSSSSMNLGQCFVATDLTCHDFEVWGAHQRPGPAAA